MAALTGQALPVAAPGAPKPFSKGSSGDCLIQALAARGIAYHYLSAAQVTNPLLKGSTVLAFHIEDVLYYFDGGSLRVSDPRGVRVPGPLIDGQTGLFVKRKDLVKSFLHRHGISVPKGAAFSRDARLGAEAFFARLLPSFPGGVCVKPTDSKKGRQVHIGLRDLASFHAAFAAVGKTHGRVLIEETVSGQVYRFTCLGGRVVGIECGRPANVEGDGTHAVAELVELKNVERRLNPGHAGTLLRLRERERSFLSRVGLRPDHVPEAGQQVLLSDVSNMHQGGEFIDVTDAVHRSYIDLIERAVKLVPDLVLCGADVVIQDAGAPATNDNYSVLGLNRGPSIAPHHYPWRGQSRDVAGAIVDYLAARAPRRLGTGPVAFSEGSSGRCLVKTLAARGIDYEYLAPDQITNPRSVNQTVISFRINGKIYYFDNICLCVPDPDGVMVPGPVIDGEMALFVRQKDLVTAFLRERGFSAPKGAAFSRDARLGAEAFFARLLPSFPGGVCVKPTDSRKGRRVHIGIRDLTSFRTAFAQVGKYHERILIEQEVSGIAYRFLYLAGRVIAIELCRPACVEGDGIHTVADLVTLKNVERRLNPSHARRLLQLGRRERSFLESSGLKPDHVPKAGELVFLTSASNMHQGGDIIDATDAVHPSYVELVERAMSLLPGLVFCGPDVAIQDASVPATADNYHFIEVNCGPGFAAHHHPWCGQPRDVAGSLIDYLTGVPPRTALNGDVG